MEGSPLEKLDEWLMRGHPLQDARLAVTESPEVKAERQDWEQAEIASLLKEAQTLRSQKERLEEQIAEAQDVNASLQSSWGALSRASTGLASSPMKDDKSWDGRDEVLSASQQSLELDLQQLQHRLRQAEVVVSRCNEEAASLERQKDQAKELAELLQEFQALQLRLDEGNRQLSSLRQSQESTEQALVALSSNRTALQEEGGALQAQLQALNEAMPKAARQQRELSLEAQKAKHELNEAQDQWQAQVRIRQSSLQVDEQQLMKQLARQESSNLKALEGRSARSDLSSKVAHLRLEYGRLLSWQQAHRMGQSDLDLFGLRASAETLRKQVESLEEELKRLRAQEADDQAALQKMRAEEARELQQIHWKSEVAQEELRAFEACGAQLKSISLEMAEEAKSLEGELQRESLKIRRLREVLPGPTLLRRASSAPQLSWREVYEQHGEVPEARPVGAIRRCRKAQAGPQAPAQPFVALPTPLVKISVARKDSRKQPDTEVRLGRRMATRPSRKPACA